MYARLDWTKLTRTREAQPVHASYARRDELPLYTPVTGYHIRYLCVTGEVSPESALGYLKCGITVSYETYEDAEA